MRTDLKDSNNSNPLPTPPNKTQKGGCFSTIMMAIGGFTLLFATIGYILHFFDMVLVIQNSKLPMVTLEVYLPLLVVGVIFILLGWLIGKLEQKLRKK